MFNDFAPQNLPILFSLILPCPLFPRLIKRSEADLCCEVRECGKDNIRKKFGNERLREERDN